VARDIDRKLRLTAAFLGAIARKDLASAFRRVNSKTTFDVGRADKWLQGRAQPREPQIYEDWAKLLEIDRSPRWLADCEVGELLDVLSERHGRDRVELERALDGVGRSIGRRGPGLSLNGFFVCYSYAWSPYFRGQVVRGELEIGSAMAADRLRVTYSEMLPTGRIVLEGIMTIHKRALRLEVGDESGTVQFLNFCLFPPTPPASVLGGLMVGTTLIGPDAQPSVTRVVIVRLPGQAKALRTAPAYLPSQGSLAEDLQSLGMPVENASEIDEHLGAFLNGGGGVFDQVSAASYRALVELFDRSWLTHTASPS